MERPIAGLASQGSGTGSSIYRRGHYRNSLLRFSVSALQAASSVRGDGADTAGCYDGQTDSALDARPIVFLPAWLSATQNL